MVFALEEINHNPDLLPGLKLGYHIRDSCALPLWAMQEAMTLVGGESTACESEAPSDLSDGFGEEQKRGVKLISAWTDEPTDERTK